MINAIKVFWVYLKSFFIDEKKISIKLTDSAFKSIPYEIEKIFDKDNSRIYSFKMPNDWKLMGSLSAGEMKLLMQNGKDQTSRTLSIGEWSNKTTLFGVINSMQVSLKDKIEKSV